MDNQATMEMVELLVSMGRNTSVPEEVIRDILSKLPVKSLIRFTAVSKRWRRLIQTPDFIAAHLRFSTGNPALLASRSNSDCKHFSMSLIDSVTKVDYLELPFLEDRHQYASVVGTINGLVCVSSSASGDLFLLWNPATKAYRQSPLSLIKDQCSRCKISLGFGYDCAADDYKLVRIVCIGSDLKSAQVEVLSWRTGSWRVIQDVDDLPYWASYLTALPAVNGELFWYADDDDDGGGFVLSFNLHDEVFKVIPTPKDIVDYGFGNFKFGVWKESLAMFVYFKEGGVLRKLDLWVMNDGGAADEPWRGVLKLELESQPWLRLLELDMLWSDSEITFKSSTGSVHFYDINTNKKLKTINISGVSEAYYNLNIDTFKYVPSLVSIYGAGEV